MGIFDHGEDGFWEWDFDHGIPHKPQEAYFYKGLSGGWETESSFLAQ